MKAMLLIIFQQSFFLCFQPFFNHLILQLSRDLETLITIAYLVLQLLLISIIINVCNTCLKYYMAGLSITVGEPSGPISVSPPSFSASS
jgi:hypothetical protein